MNDNQDLINDLYDKLMTDGYIKYGKKALTGKPYLLNIQDVLGETTELESEDVSNILMAYITNSPMPDYDLEGIVKRCLEGYL